MAAQPILQKGCWRVEDGSSIRVTKDMWSLNHPTNMVIHPPLEEEWEWRVFGIIDWRFKEWDWELIETKFHREDAEAILCMSLSRRHASDLLIWLHTKNREYCVRSGYHVARELSRQESNKGESSRADKGGLVWRHLWKLHIPNKIKDFGWRACQNALPTRENLAQCKVVEDGCCQVCRLDSDSVAHVLRQCGVAQDIWAGSLRKLQKSITGQPEFMQMVEGLIQKLIEEEQELFWVQCWTIWNQRNRVIHGGKIQNPATLIQRARDFLTEFKNTQSQLVALAITESVQKWRPPTGLAFKLNFDATIFANTNSSGVGVIIRNNLGEVMVGLFAHGPSVVSSKEAKVLACRRALEFALDSGFLGLVIEDDNVTVTKTIVSSHPNRSKLGHIYDGIRMLASGFRSFSMDCIKRSANSVAHCLARHASQLGENMVWLEESPPPACRHCTWTPFP